MSVRFKISSCPTCGGSLLVEYIGNYGTIYKVLKSGKISKNRVKRVLYEHIGDDPMLYCEKCGRTFDYDFVVMRNMALKEREGQ